MAPNVGQSVQDVAGNEVAAWLAENLPQNSPKSIVDGVLGRLQRKKTQRESKGLNHWEEYGPKYLQRLLRRSEPIRRAHRLTAFIASNHGEAVEFARRITGNLALAEEAVSRTYLEFLSGRTDEARFYHALKMNARNLLESRDRGHRRSESLESLTASVSARRFLSGDDTPATVDFPSSRLEDQDPLDILIEREEQRERNDELEHALRVVNCRGNRWILRRKWWQESALRGLANETPGTDFRGSAE